MQFVSEEQPSAMQQLVLGPLWRALAWAWHTARDIDAAATDYCAANKVLCTLLLTTFIIVSLSHMFVK
jgi:hypothetical protein